MQLNVLGCLPFLKMCYCLGAFFLRIHSGVAPVFLILDGKGIRQDALVCHLMQQKANCLAKSEADWDIFSEHLSPS